MALVISWKNILFFTQFLALNITWSTCQVSQRMSEQGWVYSSSLKDQYEIQQFYAQKCKNLLEKEKNVSTLNTSPIVDSKYCPTEMGKILCWPRTPAGQMIQQACPPLDNFFVNRNVTRQCEPSGIWFQRKRGNQSSSWSNFSNCIPKKHSSQSQLSEAHLNIIVWIGHIGYGVSLFTLFIAILVMSLLRRLRCPRNIIHMNLFASFCMRCIGHFFLINIPKDDDVSNISSQHACRFRMTFLTFAVEASWTWIFVEALYLYILISSAIINEEKNLLIICITIGWGFPLIIVIVWALLKLNLDNRFCWQQFKTYGADFWTVNIYNVLTLLINFVIFINIVRILFSKLRAQQSSDASKKLAKSTLILIMVFGIYNIVFLPSELIPKNYLADKLMLVKLYYENFLGTFQGFFIAILLCFNNSEVVTEIRKMRGLRKRKSTMRRNKKSVRFVCNSSDAQHSNLNSSFSMKKDSIYISAVRESSSLVKMVDVIKPESNRNDLLEPSRSTIVTV